MPTIKALMRTVPLTTRDVVVERSQQASQLANLMRQAEDELLAGLDDDQRRRTIARLMFAQFRLNPDDRLRCRVEPAGSASVLMAAAVAVGMIVGWITDRRLVRRPTRDVATGRRRSEAP